jgi:hypothetical protein
LFIGAIVNKKMFFRRKGFEPIKPFFRAMPGQNSSRVRGEDLSFQSFTQHATLFWPGINTQFAFPPPSRRELARPVPGAGDHLEATSRGAARLEIEILSNLSLDDAGAEELGKCVSGSTPAEERRS